MTNEIVSTMDTCGYTFGSRDLIQAAKENGMHDTITIGVPVLAILLGILLNQRGLEKLEVRMDRMNSDLSGRMDKMQADLSRFYQILGEHTGKIEMLLKK